ncbi:hypothetical protein FDP41_005379 [Naegleria fowleri]|uniref:Uncharacterized protein n=1 Tax=Naegleria fowleri TaxID=5763 RepID=A0A6A5BPA9_NAEFO|nr:uncharacterized protein FDP41_005379 [Naegleria fowleri]KAF0975385.1 hypothetical protein FDP41_005379 [Naegleria fowleri]CAG4713698.1 unnamed protein product [Naegleria fowleri]
MIHQVNFVQSLNSMFYPNFHNHKERINSLIGCYFNEFWWKVFHRNAIQTASEESLKELKEQIATSASGINRCVSLLLKMKRQILRKQGMQKNTKEDEENWLKILVTGEGGTGQSSVVLQYVNGHFPTEYNPTVQDTYRKQGVQVDGRTVSLEIVDVIGSENYAPIVRVRHAWHHTCTLSHVPCIFVINKMDVLNDPSFLVNEDEMVKEEMIFELTQHFELKNFAIIQTSAKLAQNVNEPFE